MPEQCGDRFQKDTKYVRERMPGGMLDSSSKPDVYKGYPHSQKIKLPEPRPTKGMLLDSVLKERRSIRSFSQQPINREQLSYLLWASSGIQRRERGYDLRTAPSAGALYPIETYLVVNRAEDVGSGVYHYSVKQHLLEELRVGDYGKDITLAALGQKTCSAASVVFIWTAVFYRSKWKYKQRAYRYVYLDAGHMAQNLALSAINLGLGTCQIGAFYDNEVNDIVDVDGVKESVIYMSVVGHPR